MNDDGTMARLPDLIPFARKHELKVGTIADLIQYRAANESLIERVGSRRLLTVAGEFELVAYRDLPGGGTHLALVRGEISPASETLVRVHEPSSLLDFIDVDVTTHSWPVARALATIAQAGRGVVVLLNCAESAQQLLEQFAALGDVAAGGTRVRTTRTDLRTYGIGAQILRDLHVGAMKLLAKPRKTPSMAGFGLHITGYLEG
jgi:3,4-dihydroxy 2-butanone 4-phosphate synthase/GTP cyclohydrolase II